MYTEIGKQINEAIIREWILQGHKLTGKFEAALREPDGVRVSQQGTDWVVEGWGKDYWKYMEHGVTGDKIKWPFAKARIKGLTDYMRLKFGLGDKEARSAAYGVATKHKREGMPQPFTSRTGYVKNAFELAEPTISNLIDYQIGQLIENEIKL
jgi:hypothetical protein